jgi:hypothetical protein
MRKADFDKLVAQLTGLQPATGTDEIADDTIVAAIQTHGQPVYQIAHDRGHSAGMGKKGGEVATAIAERDAAQRERDAAKTALEELKGKAPDAEKLKADYATELASKETAFKAKEAALKEKLKATQLAWAKADLKSELISTQHVDADYAAVLAERPDVIERVTHTEDGKVEIMQRGKTIPYAPGDGQTAVGLLAAELREGVNPKFITTDADAGSGAGNGGGPGKGTGFSYDGLREKVKARQEEKKPTTSAAQRMGLAPPT